MHYSLPLLKRGIFTQGNIYARELIANKGQWFLQMRLHLPDYCQELSICFHIFLNISVKTFTSQYNLPYCLGILDFCLLSDLET